MKGCRERTLLFEDQLFAGPCKLLFDTKVAYERRPLFGRLENIVEGDFALEAGTLRET